MIVENMEAEIVSSRFHRFTADVYIEKDSQVTKSKSLSQVIKCGLTFSINTDKVWRINFEISPKKSEIIFKAESDLPGNSSHTYRVVCSILNFPELGFKVFQGPIAGDGLRNRDFFKWNDVKKIQDSGVFASLMQMCFEVVDMSQDCNKIKVDNCAIIKQLHMLPFFETGQYSNFLIKTKKKDFKVHKIVLAARSPVFDAMFRSRMKETKTGVVTILNVRTEVMEELLRYMYADVTARLAEMPCELFAAAHLYDVRDLEQLCVKHMSTHICAENVSGILKLCDRYMLKEPKMAALKFIRDNEDTIVRREKYLVYLKETVTTENVVERLKLAQKYEILELKQSLFEFIAGNYKDVIKNKDYREMYHDEVWVKIILEVDEYISNTSNKIISEYVELTENNTKVFIISSICVFLIILWYLC